MDRIINVKVNGNHLTRDHRKAGVTGEGNATKLRIEFDAGWDGMAKTVTFWNALGQNPVKRVLTADLLENMSESLSIYLCPIPPEALAIDGEMEFAIDGFVNGVRARAAGGKLEVEYAPIADDAGDPADPTPSQAEQLQVQIDTLLGDITAQADRAETAAEWAAREAQSAANYEAGAQQAASQAYDYSEKAKTQAANSEASAVRAMQAQSGAQNAQIGAIEAANRAETAQAAAETAASDAGVHRTMAATALEKTIEHRIAAEAAAENAAKDASDLVVATLEHYRDAAQLAATVAGQHEEQAQEYRDDARLAADAANEYAQSVNPEETRALIDAKGDNLEFDTEEGLLYLTSGGERIGDGIKVATSGGGGGGGESNNAVLTLKNTTGWMYKSIAAGAECPVSFTWSSLEDGMSTGNGVLKILIGNTVKLTKQITQGDQTEDVGPYLAAGTNTVKINVTDTYGNSRTINLSITAVALELTSTFDATAAYEGAIDFRYVPTAAATKTVYFKMDGTEIGTATITASGREQSFTIPAQTHGCHALEVWFEAEIEGETVESNHLHYAVMCKVAGNNTPIIAVDWRRAAVEQFETLAIPYIVYDPMSLTATVSLHSSETGESEDRTVDRTQQTWNYRVENEGELELTISCVGADTSGGTPLIASVAISMTATSTAVDVEAETENLSLHLSSYGRSNTEANPGTWKYGAVEAELTNFNYTSDGWMQDDDGVTVLRVGGDARVSIPVKIFEDDFRSTGKTIEIEFASRSVLDYDAILATCFTDGRGLEITAQQALLASEKSTVTTNYKEDDHLRLSFVIEKRSGRRLIIGYVNGIISGMMQYPDNDDFSQAVPVNISIGSSDCTIDIYNIRIYESDLTRFQMLDNWIADTQDLSTKKDRFDRNNIFNDYGQILPDTLRPHQCYMVIQCPALPTYKGDKKTCSGYYVDPVHPERSFTFANAEIDVQGTSSQYYYVKNFKTKYKGGFVMQGGNTAETYAMNALAVPTAEFTYKADVASSEGANNVVLAELYNDLCPVKTPAQEADPRVRQTIEGHPIVMFHDAGNGPYFLGKYNFNNDKGTAEVFGFKPGDESWEIKENGNALVSFKSTDFSNWKTSFEARYPEDNTDITKLQAFVTWVASTDTTAAGLSEAQKAARLQKFKDELANWADVDDAIFYYLFTFIFLCIDQREKNAFPTWNADMQKWIWLFYDADSSIGTDNKGNLTFEYWMEDIDYTDAGDPVFNGQNNVFWSNLRACFPDEIKAEYRRLRTELASDGKPLLSYDRVNDLFTEHQSQWSEAIYNEDAWRKAVEPLEKVNDPQYLPMQQGKKEHHFKHWMYNRFRYLDSWAETGSALDESNRIMMRAHAQGDISLTTYINMYGQVYYNSEKVEHRMVRDNAQAFEWGAQGAEDAVIGVNSAPMITSLGDLSPLMLEYCHIQYATHLTEVKVGDGTSGYVNDNLVALTLGNNTLLKKLDARNCVSLVQQLDASGCQNIEEIYLDGSSVVGITLPNGGVLKKLRLPGTVTDLTVLNQTKLQEFVLPDYSKIATLRIENTPIIPTREIFAAIPANSRVRLIGFDWSFSSADEIVALCDRLDTMRGLDENGGNLAKAQISGTARVTNITGAQLSAIQSRYPDLKIVYQHITSNLYFYNGSTLLYTAVVADGGDGTYGGSTPTKASTAQYNYSFAGWSLTNGGSVNSNALKAVTSDRNVYAAFTSTVRKYTVKWMNGSTTLETDTKVPYGTVPTYNGSTPVDGTNGLAFIGWTPTVAAITGDTTYKAKFQSPVEVVEISDSWYTIVNNIMKNRHTAKYKVGNYKPLDLGNEGIINMQIAALDTDDLAGGAGKAPVTFIAKELLTTKKRMGVDPANWETSEMRTYLGTSIRPLVMEYVRNRLASVNKTQPAYTSSSTSVTQTTVDELWIPAEEEIYGKELYSPFFVAVGRPKAIVGTDTNIDWWTRTADSSGRFQRMTSSGYVDDAVCGYNAGVCLSFCLGPNEITDTWDQIIAAANDGSYASKYRVGDWKAIDLGTHGTVFMQIAAFDRDPLADGSGTAAITWLAKNPLATTMSGRSYPVWSTSPDRTYLENTILPLMPSNIASAIKQVQKTHLRQNANGSTSEGAYQTETTNDKLWLPSAAEVGIGSQSSGWATHYAATGEPFEIYASENCSRAKGTAYSLRDAAIFAPVNSVMVTPDGDWDNNSGDVGMLIGFCTGKTPDPWDAVFASIDAGTYKTDYAIGDTVPLNLGSEGVINMQIAAFDADTLADGTGTAAISWISKETLYTYQRWNPRDNNQTPGTGAYGGWPVSEMRAYMNETVLPLVPDTVEERIVSVSKSSKAWTGIDAEHASASYTTYDTTDLVWLPAKTELDGGIYSTLFPDQASRLKTRGKTTSTTNVGWWLRDATDGPNPYSISQYGGFYSPGPTSVSYYPVLGFCTGKSK